MPRCPEPAHAGFRLVRDADRVGPLLLAREPEPARRRRQGPPTLGSGPDRPSPTSTDLGCPASTRGWRQMNLLAGSPLPRGAGELERHITVFRNHLDCPAGGPPARSEQPHDQQAAPNRQTALLTPATSMTGPTRSSCSATTALYPEFAAEGLNSMSVGRRHTPDEVRLRASTEADRRIHPTKCCPGRPAQTERASRERAARKPASAEGHCNHRGPPACVHKQHLNEATVERGAVVDHAARHWGCLVEQCCKAGWIRHRDVLDQRAYRGLRVQTRVVAKASGHRIRRGQGTDLGRREGSGLRS